MTGLKKETGMRAPRSNDHRRASLENEQCEVLDARIFIIKRRTATGNWHTLTLNMNDDLVRVSIDFFQRRVSHKERDERPRAMSLANSKGKG